MTWIDSVLQWFAGGNRPYMTLFHCMDSDVLWIAITVALDLSVAAGYALIALHWWRNQRGLRNADARRAMGRMRNIFIFCGLCGYVFIPIKMVWPAWRLYDMFMVVLAYQTWRYAWNARDLKVVYRELGRSGELEHELKEARTESQVKTDFLNAISHDLRNPLHGMLLATEAAAAHLRRGRIEEAQSILEQSRLAAQQARGMLDNLLEAARGGWRTTRAHDVFDAVIEAGLIAGQHRPQRGVTLRIDGPVALQVRTDRWRFNRIVGNLVQNAVKYTERGEIVVRLAPEREALLVSVDDSGPGIAPHHLERIFDEFYQVGNPERDGSKGAGLGLAMARRFAVQLGGDIEVESEAGAGTRFTLVLPGACGQPGAAARRDDGDGEARAPRSGLHHVSAPAGAAG
jgi:signal transduction histidine kinase